MLQHVTPSQMVAQGVPESEAVGLSTTLNRLLDAGTAETCWREIVRTLPKDRLPYPLFTFLYAHIFSNRDPNLGPVPAWSPTHAEIQSTNIHRLMQECSLTAYDDLYSWSVTETEAFWKRMLDVLGIHFQTPPTQTLDLSKGAEHPDWLVGARLNITDSCFLAPDDQVAIVHARKGDPPHHQTYGELRVLSNRVANGLTAAGFKRGDALAIDMPMTAETVALYLGIIKAGMVVVSIADSMAPDEIATRLNLAGAKGVFTQDVIVRGQKTLPMYEKIRAAGAPTAIVLSAEKEKPLQVSLRERDLPWEDFLSELETFEAVQLKPLAHTNILFSSGTTGTPKAIPWNQTTPIKAAADGYLHLNIQPGHVVAWPTNLGWMMGPWLIYASLINRATIALYYDAPTDEDFCRFVQQSKINVLGLVPSIVKAWRANDAMLGIDWSHLQCFGSTGECSNPDDYLYLMIYSGLKPMIEYCGGTEIGGGYLTGTMVQPASPATFSTPALGSAFTILDEHGTPTENGEVFLVPPAMGLSQELLNRDHHEAYYSDAPLDSQGRILRRHGDQIEALPGGYFRAHGRVDDTMNLGGIKVSSIEIERLLDGLEGIRRTAAIAVPPPGGGPGRLVICAVAEKAEAIQTEEQKAVLKKAMQDIIKTKLNPLFKIQDVSWMDALPVTASNKVMRRSLRAQFTST